MAEGVVVQWANWIWLQNKISRLAFIVSMAGALLIPSHFLLSYFYLLTQKKKKINKDEGQMPSNSFTIYTVERENSWREWCIHFGPKLASSKSKTISNPDFHHLIYDYLFFFLFLLLSSFTFLNGVICYRCFHTQNYGAHMQFFYCISHCVFLVQETIIQPMPPFIYFCYVYSSALIR